MNYILKKNSNEHWRNWMNEIYLLQNNTHNKVLKLHIYFKTKVVGGICGFLFCGEQA
jgi:hypothetical protein